jgi:hypothetical protein
MIENKERNNIASVKPIISLNLAEYSIIANESFFAFQNKIIIIP